MFEVDMVNGDQLKEIRQSHNMSQRKAARLLNITPGALSNYELNKRDPGNDFINAFAILFNLTNEEKMNLVFDSQLKDGLERYADKNGKNNFVFLEPSKIKELPIPELEKIKDYANYIYDKFLKSKR